MAIRLSFPEGAAGDLTLRGPRIRLGSGSGNEVVLRGPSVHPLHALLLAKERGFDVVDLSGDGVDLGGRRVVRAAVQHGDLLRIADHRIRCELAPVGGADAPREPTEHSPGRAPSTWAADRALLRTRHRSDWRSLRIGHRPIFLGKSPDNDLVVDGPTVSRWHCRVLPGPGGLEVEDLGSTNGTFVGGARIARASVPIGAEIRLGLAVVQVLPAEIEAASDDTPSFAGLVGGCPRMLEVFRAIERYAGERDPVLLFGETGTGKELVARALHDQGPRRVRPFVAVNCGALPRDLVESELFGHERGAFSGAVAQRNGLFEEADGGTLFLDEVAELPPEAQSKLLRVLESCEVRRVGSNATRRVDVRVVAAANRRIEDLVQEGRFRRDLFHRLCVIELRLPPLRERGADLDLLARHFLADSGKVPTAAALARLRLHAWPGNVRELRNVLRRASLAAEGVFVEPGHLEIDPQPPAAEEPLGGASLADLERRAIVLALTRHGGNKAAASRSLGISRSTLFEKIRRHGLGR